MSPALRWPGWTSRGALAAQIQPAPASGSESAKESPSDSTSSPRLEIAQTSAAIASPFLPPSGSRPSGRTKTGVCGSGGCGASSGPAAPPGGCGGSHPPGSCGSDIGRDCAKRDLSHLRARRRSMTLMAVPAPRRPAPPPAVRAPEGEPAAAPPRREERRLVRGAQGGSREDFEALFALHWPRAYRTAWLVVHDAAAAEDIAQEGFIAALGALDRFDRRRPFGPWLSRIVVNRAIDWARARRLQPVPTEAAGAAAPQP